MALVKARKIDGAKPAAAVEGGDPLAWLEDADPALRRRAAHALGERPDAVPALSARLTREEEPSVRETLLTALVRTGTAEAAAALVPYLASEDVGLRNGVIESLQQMPAAVVMPEVAPLLTAADSDLRIFAAQLIGKLPHPDRLARLAGVIDHDPHVNVCLSAVEALMESGDPAALPVVERLGGRFPDDPFVAFSVDAARRLFSGA
ncbi:HEAT repeat domain-containing protein [Azospirillum sp. YIM DDC1]|uniref:HEAT repeat domain-containing protein n=1 Tax=Azospirillum aestuarii TaxID=2802052 RepID=A0ABS1I578_9PROT|nr:HEAT repeat domain-containing protein [Azospirillum aestuarii]MBK3772987.1 HEAT repeat domain-containing protein [Azospirillum brasilense]MBK4722229.1 HEAT repeat domain-containing protein [Azospirillum aestuarii]